MNKIKFSDGTRLLLKDISSTAISLTFSVLDDSRNELEAILKDSEKTTLIQFLSVNETTQDETVVKAYSGYNTLKTIKTEYGVVTNIDYSTQDETTESGFAEEKHDITTVILIKPSKTESELAAIRESQALQDGAIEEMASMLSNISEGQELQDGAIEDIAIVVSEIAEESEVGA